MRTPNRLTLWTTPKELSPKIDSELRPKGQRLRERRLYEDNIIAKAVALATDPEASTSRHYVIHRDGRTYALVACHGGDVCNNYGYADTEAVAVVARDDGCVVGSGTRIPANKATVSGAVASCLGCRGPYDGRYHAETQLEALGEFIDSTYTRPMLAAMGVEA